jgi:hypothetical protein
METSAFSRVEARRSSSHCQSVREGPELGSGKNKVNTTTAANSRMLTTAHTVKEFNR